LRAQAAHLRFIPLSEISPLDSLDTRALHAVLKIYEIFCTLCLRMFASLVLGRSGEGIITKMEAKWKVGALPAVGGAFYSPWFGVESSDNLNLIQPVNPFDGSNWQVLAR
jgi:hypothetical protein